MTCTNPIRLTKNIDIHDFKNGYIFVPCGKCIACRIAHSKEWALRVIHENEFHKSSVFLTLTYNEANLPKNYTLVKKDLQDFFKRLRYYLDKEKRKIKYFACGEYGERYGRPHYHAIVFGLSLDDEKRINDVWGKGYIKLGTVTYDSARYVSQYIDKKYSGKMAEQYYSSRNREAPFKLSSNGLGKSWVLQNIKNLVAHKVIHFKQSEHTLPRYYKKILYSLNLVTKKEFYQLALKRSKELVKKLIKSNKIPASILPLLKQYDYCFYADTTLWNLYRDVIKRRVLNMRDSLTLRYQFKMRGF